MLNAIMVCNKCDLAFHSYDPHAQCKTCKSVWCDDCADKHVKEWKFSDDGILIDCQMCCNKTVKVDDTKDQIQKAIHDNAKFTRELKELKIYNKELMLDIKELDFNLKELDFNLKEKDFEIAKLKEQLEIAKRNDTQSYWAR